MSVANGFGIYANGTLGANGLVLTSNGTSLYWGSVSDSSGGGFTGNTVSANSTIVKNQSYNVNAAAGWVTMTMPSTVATGDIFIVHSLGGNTRILNNSINIMDVGAGNDLVLENGETVWLQAVNATAVDILFTYPAGGVPSIIANASFATTANNSLFAYGKQESQLSVASAAQLTTTRTIGDVNFNGTANIVPERIYLKDTRAVDFAPTTYPGVTLHLKNNGADGLTDGGTYHGILNLQHWTDTSGGNIHQLALTDNNNIWIRQSTNSTAWGSWAQVVTTISGLAANANFATTANNALRLNGKQESQLSVANAVFATTANNSLYAYGKQESQLSVALAQSATSAGSASTANNATYAYGRQESQLNVATSLTSNNSTYAYGKQESQLSVASATSATSSSTANNATYAYGKQESQLSVASATTAGSASSVSGAVAATTLTASANVNLDSGTLFIDATTNRVGIGNTTPGQTLQVDGSIGIKNALIANGVIGANGTVLTSNGSTIYWGTVSAGGTSYTFSTGLTNTSGTITVNAAYIATISSNNASFAYGKQESQLSVALAANATFATTANNSLYAYGKQESQLSVASATNSTNSTNATNANNSTWLGGRTWASPSAIGSTVANTGAFTTLSAKPNQTGAIAGLDVSNNSVGIFMVPRASSGSYNNLVSTNDNLIYFSNNTVNNGNLVIGSWTDRAAGYGMRMSSQNYEVAVTANSFVTNANNIFNSVTTLRSGGAAINLTGATSNRIVWNESGVAAPSFASYSNGVKLVLYGNNNGTNLAGYAIGIESGTMWFGTDSTSSGFKWYGGTTNYMSANTTALYHTGNITAYSSDKRLKKNITPIEEPIKKIQQIGGYTFDWDKELCEKYEFIPGQTHEHGVIAQEIEKIIPDAVTRAPFDIGKDGESKTGENYLTVRYDRIVPLLIEAVKEQQKEIDTLKELVKTLINKEQDNG